MITGLTSEAARYANVHPAFAAAFAFLNSPEPTRLPVGSHERDGFTAVVIETAGKGVDDARLESHIDNIDVHMTLVGSDLIGWCPRDRCTTPDGEFDESNDIGFYRDRPEMWLPVSPGEYAVFFPEDGHAPLAGEGPIRKVVLKVPNLKK